MVSSTLCPAVHILGSQNVYARAEGIADHYWPWAVFYFYLSVYLSINSYLVLGTSFASRQQGIRYIRYLMCFFSHPSLVAK